MAQQDVTGDIVRAALDRTSSGQHGGSISLVLAIATVLVGATAGLVLIGRGHAEPYVLGFLALMAMIGVFLLFALAAGILRMAGKDTFVLTQSVIAALNHWTRWQALAAVAVGVIAYALLALLHPQRQFWHDALCGTRLVDARP